MSNRLTMTLTCKICGCSFHPFAETQTCCSRKCYNTIRSKHRRQRIPRICVICGKAFETRPHRALAKYCSRSCWNVRAPLAPRPCQLCGKPFQERDPRKKFCSGLCSYAARSGTGHWNWKGGTSTTEREIDQSRIATWRKKVFRRDGYKCRRCGVSGELQAHHIKSWADFPRLRFRINNGETVCVACHEKIHGRKLGHKRSILIPGKAVAILSKQTAV